MSTTLPPNASDGVVLVKPEGDLLVTGGITNIDINSTTDYVPLVATGLIFGSLCLLAVVSVILFIVVLIVGNRKFQEHPFFVIVWHLTVANAIHIALVVTSILPLMLVNINDSSSNQWYIWSSRILDLTESASLYLMFLMAVNRFVVFVIPQFMGLFTKRGIMIMSLIIWLYSLFIVVWRVNFGAIVVFKKKKEKPTFFTQLLGGNFLIQFFNICTFVLPLIMLTMYGIIVYTIMKKRNSTDGNTRKISRGDKAFLWQALCITIAIELSALTGQFVSFFQFSDQLVLWVWTLFNYSTALIQQMANPLISLTCNRMVRVVLIQMFKKNTSSRWLSESSSNQTGGNKIPRKITKTDAYVRKQSNLVTEVH